MELLLLCAVGAMNIVCFLVGARVGQAVSRGEKVLPAPTEVIREHKAKAKQEQEMDRVSTILHNIENYDGTSIGQRDVPKR
jgi:RNase H-fold protein (predicted Holliday junction resolvase)